MQGEIQPTSAPGRRFVDLAETHAAAFDQDAAAHDQSAAFPHQHVEAVKQSGAIGAMVPAELGGLDVRSLHDLAAALTRFGRGDASITIGLSMHFLGTWNIARQWHAARATGKETSDAFLRDVAEGRAVMAILNAEPRSDNRHPFAEATPADGGYRINGRKSFGTLSPAATHLSVRFRIPTENGGYQTSSALIRADDPGVTNVGNWDAMGMRASGSHDVELKDVFVPLDATTAPATWGKLDQPGLASAAASPAPLPSANGLPSRQLSRRTNSTLHPCAPSSPAQHRWSTPCLRNTSPGHPHSKPSIRS